MRVLIADDDRMYRSLLSATLARWGFDVVAVDGGEKVLELLAAKDAPTLVVMDWKMPGMSGPEVCRRLRAQAGPRYTYVLLLTGQNKIENVVEGLEAGADDYLTKPFAAMELRARLRTAQRILDLQDKLLDSHRELEELATHDPLTQLWNRRAILNQLAHEGARAEREKSFLTVLLADVDHFKEVNDRRGHHTGDLVLCEVARRMSGALRPYDELGRFGGEEFLVSLTTETPEAVNVIAERLRAAVAAGPLSVGEEKISLTVSVGVAIAHGSTRINTESLIHAADSALYRAKHEGRNRVCMALSNPDPRPVTAAY